MNKEFSRRIALLRKERKVSQREVSQSLNVSQALLSHYEKGIRECSLDFVVKAADYYNVSCDYLLGRTADRGGTGLIAENLPDSTDEKISNTRYSLTSTVNKRLIINSINLIFDLLEASDAGSITNEFSSYMLVTVYKLFRIIYSANEENLQDIFCVDYGTYEDYCNAYKCLFEAALKEKIIEQRSRKKHKNSTLPRISTDTITDNYPELATSLLNLIQLSEKMLKQ